MDLILKVIEIAQTAGPFGAVLGFYLYLRENAERRDLQKQLFEQLPKVLDGLNSVDRTLQGFTAMLSGRRVGNED